MSNWQVFFIIVAMFVCTMEICSAIMKAKK
jgi:hypothetical protein